MCEKFGHCFRDRVYTPVITLWMFLRRVLSPDHPCRDAVHRLNAWRTSHGKNTVNFPTQSQWDRFMDEAKKRAYTGQLPLSSQHCWSACKLGFAIGGIAAIIEIPFEDDPDDRSENFRGTGCALAKLCPSPPYLVSSDESCYKRDGSNPHGPLRRTPNPRGPFPTIR